MRLLTGALTVTVVSLAACDRGPTRPERPPDWDGWIVESTIEGPNASPLWRILVERPPDDPCGVWFVVRADTGVLMSHGGPLRPAGAEALRTGVNVAVWADGGIAESCPGQGVATVVEITGVPAPEAGG